MADLEINTQKISQKYRTNVPRLIRAWKKGLSDPEIAQYTGVSATTLYQIRSELELAHRRVRLTKKRQALNGAPIHTKRHILLRPLL
ncbi:MAG: helix-turn-helix domain-containing protein [Firmicutes bacterium]|nr:helix-turn-helix domain-containing protein [Bacillota bacterium]